MVDSAQDIKQTETIFSLSSAAGRAGVSVFRVSGPDAESIIAAMTKRPCPAPRAAALRKLYKADDLIDEALVLWFPAPASFTGEDCAEFQVHGSLAVIEAMAHAFAALGARQSEAGEFTKRAFDNGKMDLTEAEGLADLIDSETEGQRKQAVRQMQGGLRAIYENWRETLLDALAQIEGEIDFPDEADIPDGLSHKAYPYLSSTIASMEKLLTDGAKGERIRAGLDIAIIGAPNAGKSSLINSLAGREAAITSSDAGTTRDIIEVQLTLAGLPVRLSDTAGLREADNAVEAEGVKRAKARAIESDIRIFVQDSSSNEWDAEALGWLGPNDFCVLNKSDLGAKPDLLLVPCPVLTISAKTQEGLDGLRAQLEARITEMFSPSQDAGLTRARHRDCVVRAKESASRALENLGYAPELSGDDIRRALHAIKELAGETDIERVFDRIFSRFCVGK